LYFEPLFLSVAAIKRVDLMLLQAACLLGAGRVRFVYLFDKERLSQ